jgi:CelD/BcsL family acetyltransferase involved in cellulose biosynthesis
VLGPIGAGFLLRGPVWHDPIAGAAHYQAVLAGIRQRLARRMLVWAPEAPCHQARRPIISGYGTAWLDLDRGAEMVRQGLAPDWRRDLRRAEAGGLTVRQLATPQAIGWLLERNEAHRRKVGYRGPTRQFLEQLALAAHEARELVLLLAFERAEPVAGLMVIRHGGSATYEVGHVAPRGRELRAGHLLLWHAITALIRKQARWLDLGGIATDRSPGIARFKLGMGGMVATLPGTFLMGGGMRA